MIPELIWISAIYSTFEATTATNIVKVLFECFDAAIEGHNELELALASAYRFLDPNELISINAAVKQNPTARRALDAFEYQNAIFRNFPLSFLYDEKERRQHNEGDVSLLSRDVERLLDRSSLHTTLVQGTVILSELLQERLHIGKGIQYPDVAGFFRFPSEERLRDVGGVVRIHVNVANGLLSETPERRAWAQEFWRESFVLKGCI